MRRVRTVQVSLRLRLVPPHYRADTDAYLLGFGPFSLAICRFRAFSIALGHVGDARRGGLR